MHVRYLQLLLPILAMIFGGMVYAQSTPKLVDSTEIKALDANNSHGFGTLGPFGGSGEGEEPPGYHGEWWGEGDVEYNGNDFHTGDDFQDVANDIVRMEIGSINGGAIPKAIGKLRNLRELLIDYDGTFPLPSGLWSLPKLERLTLRPRANAKISPDIINMKAIKQLAIIGGLSDTVLVPNAIGKLSSLESLSLLWCRTEAQGLNLSGLNHLKYLMLKGMNMENVPSGIGKLVALDTLIMSENTLVKLPPEIGNLAQLTHLDLASNHLNSLPPQIGALRRLRSLILQGNAIIYLPTEIGSLTDLRELNLERNQLRSLPESIGPLEKLEHLDLSSNVLTSLPNSLGGLQSLNTLVCDHNQLSTLPTSIGNLHQLMSLYLSENPMTDLPREFIQLKALGLLYLDKAGLLELPRETWDFINQFGGKFTSVPTEIAGKPLAYYLAHPDIDAFSKRYIQGDLALFAFEGLNQIQDSLCTNNPETAPFYLYQFSRYWKPLDAGDTWFGLRQLFGSERVAAAFILQHPCAFISQVKNGRYSDLYIIWIRSARGNLWQANHEYSTLFLALQAKMHADCGENLDRDLLQMVKDLRD